MSTTAIQLNRSQITILQALCKLRPSQSMTKAQLAEAAPDAAITNANLGVSKRDAGPDSLYALGYVAAEQHDVDGRMTVMYRATPKGRSIAARLRNLTRSSPKVPTDLLDKALVAFRPLRSYGIDAYTEDDVEEIRRMIGPAADGVSVDDFRQQMANRRKQGVFADPTDKVKRAARSALEAFGPEGWVQPNLLDDVAVQSLQRIAATGQVDAG